MYNDKAIPYGVIVVELKTSRRELVHTGSSIADVERDIMEQQELVTDVG